MRFRVIQGGSSPAPQEDYNTTSFSCQEKTVINYYGEVTNPHHGGKVYEVELTDEEEELLDEEFDRIFGDEYETNLPEDIFSG